MPLSDTALQKLSAADSRQRKLLLRLESKLVRTIVNPS